MIPGGVLEVDNGEIFLGMQFLFMVDLGALWWLSRAGQQSPGGRSRSEVAALELVGAP